MNLKKKLIHQLIFLIALMPQALAQFNISATYPSPILEKSVIDTGMLFKWPNILTGRPILTEDGQYAAYFIHNQPLYSNTLIVQATQNNWKKEFITSDIYFFSSDDKRLYWKSEDTLFFIALGQEKIGHIPNIAFLKLPQFKIGEWIAYQQKSAPSDLKIRNLVNGKELRFDAVVDYLFDDRANAILIKTSIQGKDSIANITLKWVDLVTGQTTIIWCSNEQEQVVSYNFDKKGEQLTFMVDEQNDNIFLNSIWYYKKGMDKAIIKVNNRSTKLEKSTLTISSPAYFSENGRWLFFGLKAPDKQRIPNSEAVQVDIWSYKDRILYPTQLSNTSKERLGAVATTNNNDYIYISEEDDQLEGFNPKNITGDYIVIRDYKQAPIWWALLPPPSYWLVSLKTGNKTLLKKDCRSPLWGFSFSPTGQWLVYWDSAKSNYICYDLQRRKSTPIDNTPPLSREPDYIDGYHPDYSQPVDEPAAWYISDDALLIYDRYDIWKIDPKGMIKPRNITNGYGAKHHIKLRLVYGRDEMDRPITLSESDSVLLTGFNTLNKYNGFFITQLDEEKDPILLTLGPYTYYLVESQKPHNYSFGDGIKPIKSCKTNNTGWIVQRSSTTEFPNYFFSTDLRQYHALTNLQPHQKYNWLTAELHSWKQLDGSTSQGILYKPENFDSKKKYPVILNYYEMLSHRLYGFPYPGLTDANIDISWFVSRGYLVFTPDIHFSTASSKGGKIVGESAYNSIESAALYLEKLPYVNKNKIGIQGHSFGGGITNYMITRSKRFAAACSAAGTVSNQVSAYLGMTRANGYPPHEFRLRSTETGIDRLGATLWQRPDLFIKASPVFKADQVTTPLLIMHNQGDRACDWGQSAELYMALRRLGKKVWMLQYDNEDHGLVDKKNAIDFTIRITQFFDYYLKDAAPPKWMTEGIPPSLKGIETGYELDSSGKKP